MNGHLLIEPLVQDQFIASGNDRYQEIGVVIAYDPDFDSDRMVWNGTTVSEPPKLISVGDKVYFDSWLAAKFPNGNDAFYWLVKWEDIRAVEHAPVPE